MFLLAHAACVWLPEFSPDSVLLSESSGNMFPRNDIQMSIHLVPQLYSVFCADL